MRFTKKVQSVDIPESIYNPLFYKYRHFPFRYLVLVGGAGSGKSWYAGQHLLFDWLLQSETKERILIVRKVARTIRNSQYRLLQDQAHRYGVNKLLDFRRSNLEVHTGENYNGNMIVSAGVDDPEKLKSIQGITKIWIEEATELTAEDFTQLDLRLRGQLDTNFQFILTFNPVDEHHWLNKEFFLKRKPGALTIRSTYRNNRFIDENFERVLQSISDPNLRRIYAEGLWGVLANIIYEPFEPLNYWPKDRFFDEKIYGLDFGFNNPTALVEIGIKDEEIYVRECIYKSGLLTGDLIDLMNKIGVDKSAPIYADHDLEKIEQLHRAGFLIYEANKDVINGIDHVKSKKIRSFVENENLHRERQSYVWMQDKNGVITETPAKINDHLLDALRYGLFTHSKKPSIGVAAGR